MSDLTADLSPQERAVLDLITANPFVGQAEIADALGLARSTVAQHIVALGRKGRILGRGYVLATAGRIVTVGGAALDRKYVGRGPLVPETSNPVDGHRSFGGVARNVTENLARLGARVAFVTATGDDDTGRALLAHLRDLGVDTSAALAMPGAATAEYVAILEPDGKLTLGLADMAVLDTLTPAAVGRAAAQFAAATWVFADCNLPADTLADLRTRRIAGRYRLAVDAVSTPKVMKLGSALAGLDLLFLNLDEARALANLPRADAIEAARRLIALGAATVVLTLGSAGALVADAHGAVTLPAVAAHPVDVTGAGDALIAGTLADLAADTSLSAADAVRTGMLAAALTTESDLSVRPDLSRALLTEAAHRLPAPSALSA
jgi:pseudouridine kinase